jgi:hypothetical protein
MNCGSWRDQERVPKFLPTSSTTNMTLSAPLRRQVYCLSPPPREEPSPSVHLLRAANRLRLKLANRPAQSERERCPRLRAAITAALLLGFSLPATASLGGNVGSVESDRAQMNASLQVTQHGSYAVHEMQVPGGTVVDEYVAPDGQVFAVSWHGQFPPPMQQILGTYFQQYSAALQAQSSQAQPKMYGHRPLNIQQQGLVVQTSGHMRAYSGRAYIPDLLPQGMTVNQIQ